MLKRAFSPHLLTGLQSRFFHAECARTDEHIRQDGRFCSASGADSVVVRCCAMALYKKVVE